MAKKVAAVVKLQIPGSQATPAPPVGPALGQHGVNIMDFCKAFNERSKDQTGTVVPVIITIYQDRSFSFVTKTPPASILLKEAAQIEKGSAEPNREKVGILKEQDLRRIAERKMPDLNANSVEAAMEMIRGTARSMGIEVKD